MIDINNVKLESGRLSIQCELKDVCGEWDGDYEVIIPSPYIARSMFNKAYLCSDHDAGEYEEEYCLNDETYVEIFATEEVKTELEEAIK